MKAFLFHLADSCGKMLRLRIASREEPCDFCTKKDTPFRCPRCKSAFYCSREHLKSDWKLHKRKCSGYNESGNQPAITDRICLRDNGFIGLGANPYSSDPYHVNRIMQKSQSEVADFVVKTLYLTGHCIIDNFNGKSLALKMLEETKALHRQGFLKDGQLASEPNKNGNKALNQKTVKIREDKIAWVDSQDPRCQATAQHMFAVDKLIYMCNKLLPDHDVRVRTKVRFWLQCTSHWSHTFSFIKSEQLTLRKHRGLDLPNFKDKLKKNIKNTTSFDQN